jgi:hypothetical protein
MLTYVQVQNGSVKEKPMARKIWTMPIPAAGKKYYGLSRSPSYAAADRGEIPTIRIGRRRFALPAVIERQLGQEHDDDRGHDQEAAA